MTRKTMTLIICSAVSAAVFASLLCDRSKSRQPAPVRTPPSAGSVSERFDYFASHGWEVEEVSVRDITIPSDFSGGYADYAALQDKQGLTLRQCAGKQAQLYVYDVKNYSPGSQKMLAELIVCESSIVASLIYSEDGESCQMPVS